MSTEILFSKSSARSLLVLILIFQGLLIQLVQLFLQLPSFTSTSLDVLLVYVLPQGTSLLGIFIL